MKKKVLLITLLVTGAIIAAACGRQAPTVAERHSSHPEATTKTGSQTVSSQSRVPAFQDVKSAQNLPPTLSPEQFYGPTRDAYRVAQEIPETIAQLPCYCHCDQSIGHKSLHSCFQDTHASQCAVCVNEALIAYNMQRSG
ncbi:MAG TPA: CYCXC family (seleno)protein, partial [Pyrinomonadaceae bacterium]|nr:CYCXC family (seleno)protein [Pyrinomonadaceae bacterium]